MHIQCTQARADRALCGDLNVKMNNMWVPAENSLMTIYAFQRLTVVRLKLQVKKVCSGLRLSECPYVNREVVLQNEHACLHTVGLCLYWHFCWAKFKKENFFTGQISSITQRWLENWQEILLTVAANTQQPPYNLQGFKAQCHPGFSYRSCWKRGHITFISFAVRWMTCLGVNRKRSPV